MTGGRRTAPLQCDGSPYRPAIVVIVLLTAEVPSRDGVLRADETVGRRRRWAARSERRGSIAVGRDERSILYRGRRRWT
jgi:hypothetical protein